MIYCCVLLIVSARDDARHDPRVRSQRSEPYASPGYGSKGREEEAEGISHHLFDLSKIFMVIIIIVLSGLCQDRPHRG